MKFKGTKLFDSIKNRNQGIDGARLSRELNKVPVNAHWSHGRKEWYEVEVEHAFDWVGTPQGFYFWCQLRDGEGFPK